MSTFNGLVSEFPDIRIDFFRRHPAHAPPLACFLSHVHSDHLAGLDTLRSPFVYCSPATREILLRLEKYPCRINFARGILEARQQTYKHLRKVLKALPLGAPTMIELRPGTSIQVTLFDANHCPGAVMFLIEGRGKAVLYTGDVRAEPWFVNSMARDPCLLEYTCGLQTLDKIYLDTSFLDDIPFQTKSEGLADLLAQVRKYPADTVFHFQAWTFGYEDVWIALSKALNSRIHVDDYKLRLYQSLRHQSDKFQPDFHMSAEAAPLAGHMCGNTMHAGCLTSDPNVRIHSCEKGNMCSIARGANVVSIRPIVARLPDGQTLAEAGVGGGGNDFAREAQLTWPAEAELLQALSTDKLDVSSKTVVSALIRKAIASGRDMSLNMTVDDFDDEMSTNMASLWQKLGAAPRETPLPRVILFPYARHSTFEELRQLVKTFTPRDVWPCTFDAEHWRQQGMSIESLFGEYCYEKLFTHDIIANSLIRTPEPDSQALDTPTASQTPAHRHDTNEDEPDSQQSYTSAIRPHHSCVRHDAYNTMLCNADGDSWAPISLICTERPEIEL